ncbi:hypothetical protein LPJ60_004508 [Coemansia sp. RSA 2675]|nr:hypothetical protein LPJ60_004508 [Coemansia sp. RSA 2675]
MKELPQLPPLPPKDDASTPLTEKQQLPPPPPPAAFFSRSSPAPLASTIAQRRLQQRKPMGLQLNTTAPSPLAPGPLASAALVPPPPPATAMGTWTQRAPDSQHIGRHHHHESPGRRLPPISSSSSSSSRLARAAATPGLTIGVPAPAGGCDTQESLKSFQEAVNASTLTSSFSLRPSLLGASAASFSPKSEVRKPSSNRGSSSSSRQTQRQQKRVTGLNYLASAKLASKLADRASGVANSEGVVIDMRKSADYTSSRIRSAVGITVPTTLVKRPNFTIQRLLAMLHAPEAQKQQMEHWNQAPWVTIYGDGAPEDTASEDALLVLLARKFMSEAPDTCCVYVLEGGYAEFSRLHPALCEFGTGDNPSAEVLPTVRLSLPALASAPQGDKPTMDFDHPMLRKLRQEPSGGPNLCEVISMRMPPEFAALKPVSMDTPPASVNGAFKLVPRADDIAAPLTPRGFASLEEMQLKVLPAYLRLVADPSNGPGILVKMFNYLDSAENQRLKTMIENSGVVTKDNKFTISAGLELGTKNRYTTILPFDRTRVKLHKRPSRPSAVSRHVDKGKAVADRGGNVNKPLPPIPPASPLVAVGGITPVGTPVGGISGSAAHLRLRMQGERPVSYDHSVAISGGPTKLESSLFGGEGTSEGGQATMLMAKRSSQQVEISKRGKSSLTSDHDDHSAVGMDENGRVDAAKTAAIWSAMPAGIGGRAEGDYINASYLSYFGGPLYIGTQGPMPETMGDFWHMVWEQKSRVVIMLTKDTEHGRAKCHQYWPSHLDKSLTYGEIEVLFEAEAMHPDDHSVISRRLRLSYAGESVVVAHLQYLGWPDHGVPENPLGVLRLRQLAHSVQAEAEAEAEHGAGQRIPMVVHCSAGCGRTGAFCAIDTLLGLAEAQPLAAPLDADGDVSMRSYDDGSGRQQRGYAGPAPPVARSDSTGSLDSSSCGQSLGGWVDLPPAEYHDNLVFMVVARFREQRMMAVQTGKQFAFCHETLAWALLGVGPRPLERVVDRRLVAEWNRANHPGLSAADCTDITYLMRGRQEMVNAMQQSAASAAAAVAGAGGDEGGGCVAASRASVDVSGSSSVMAPPMIKRSNTVGPARRGLFGSIFRPGSSSEKAASPSPGQPTAAASGGGSSSTRQLREMELVSSVIMASNEQLSAVAEEELSASSYTAERPLPPLPTTCGAEALEVANDYFGAVQSDASGNISGSSGSYHLELQPLSAGSSGQAQTPSAAEWRRSVSHHLESDAFVQSPHAHLSHQLHLHHFHSSGAASNGGTTPLASPSALASPRVK